ncbi:DnaJ domain-containing protein, partial [Treponema pallidum]
MFGCSLRRRCFRRPAFVPVSRAHPVFLCVRANVDKDSLDGVIVAKKDYYEVLGISKTASGEEIKKAYRRLAI